MTLLDMKIEMGGGVIAGPQGLGIFVAPTVEDLKRCPKGWICFTVDEGRRMSADAREEVLEGLRSGRAHWPKADG